MASVEQPPPPSHPAGRRGRRRAHRAHGGDRIGVDALRRGGKGAGAGRHRPQHRRPARPRRRHQPGRPLAVPRLRPGPGPLRHLRRPGATAGVTPTGINDLGQVIGKYNTGTSPSGAGAGEHGFLRDRRGRVTRIDVPGARSTATTRINDRGQIVGVYSQNTGRVGDDPNRRGFMLGHGKLIRIDYPGAMETQACGLNNLGQVVGEYQDATGFHAFRCSKGRFTTIDAPGAVGTGGTSATGINDFGDVVGTYATDPTGKPGTEHGFVPHDGVFTSFDAPGSALTLAFDVNDHGQIVLTGQSSTPAGPVRHGFVLAAVAVAGR
jgi:hypothetical protein